MSRLNIELAEGKKNFFPEETVEGTVLWQLDRPPKNVALRLFWYTRGKGTEDIEVVREISFENPMQNDSRPFTISLPRAPYSFSGKLVSLVWALELAASPKKSAAQKEIVISPYGHEVDLYQSSGSK